MAICRIPGICGDTIPVWEQWLPGGFPKLIAAVYLRTVISHQIKVSVKDSAYHLGAHIAPRASIAGDLG